MSFELWRSLALTPPRAVEPPAGTARLRVQAEDFEVHEELGFAASGQGEHVLLQVRKRLANTTWVARELARAAGVRHFDVGYAGLKDRNAVTTQWFTVPARRRDPASWLGAGGEGYEVVAAMAHTRKLPRGALAGNRFRIALRDFAGDTVQLERRVAEVAMAGVPNYFGPQRFGRDLGNLRGAFADAERGERGCELSALRSLLFNAVLAARVARQDWCRLQVGERANLDGSNSSFVVQALDESIASRLAALDIHPTGPLYGRGESGMSGDIAALEAAVIGQFPQAVARLERDRLEASRRPLRVAVRDLELSWLDSGRTPVLSFRLRPGSFATTVLRELIDVTAAAGSEDEHD
ncbi:MAG: tRNA pseudouridine(13) synthase TruD [Gammaproteobacteria bacterium]